MADAVLEVRDLCVDYATRSAPARAVERVSFDLHRGEFMAIVGESGCGKSTLLFAIARLLTPPAELTGGDVRFNGTSMVQLGEKQLRALRWRDFSVVMQSAMNALNPVKSIAAQYRDAMKAHDKRLSKADIEERSREVLLLVGIDPVHLHSYPHQLSGGMRQRAMIAMALLFSPELILMDEPTSALDVVAQRSLMTKVKELQERLGFAIVFVTHDMSLVSNFSDRLAVMYAGQLSEIGPTELLFADPKHPYTKGLLDAFPSIYGERVELAGIPGSPPDLSEPPSGCHFHPRCSEASERCARVAPGFYDLGERQVRCLLYVDEGADRG